jgi:hypothetical protein
VWEQELVQFGLIGDPFMILSVFLAFLGIMAFDGYLDYLYGHVTLKMVASSICLVSAFFIDSYSIKNQDEGLQEHGWQRQAPNIMLLIVIG